MRLIIIVLALLYCCFHSLGAATLDGDEDSVTINGNRFKSQASVLPQEVLVPLEGTACDSLKNERGQCRRVSDCYPLLFPSTREELLGSGLVHLLKLGNGVCEPDYIIPVAKEEPAPPEEFICCTSGQSSTQLPSLPELTPGFHPFVVGGEKVSDISKYPWMASIQVHGYHTCGGSLINRYTVLTAAHCVKDMRTTDVATMRLYFGHHDMKNLRNPGVFEVRKAAQVKYHRLFSMTKLQNDIALIVLDRPIENHPKVTPVNYTEVAASDTMASLAGWGKTSWDGPTSPVLLEASMRVWTNPECQTKYRYQVDISSMQVCAASPGKESCRGDSGGPLHVNRNGVLQQIGIVSFGGKCAGEVPGVYTRVASFRDWIEKNQKL